MLHILALSVLALSTSAGRDQLQSSEHLSPHSPVKVLDGGIRVRGWSYEVVPSKHNHLAMTLFITSRSRTNPKERHSCARAIISQTQRITSSSARRCAHTASGK